MSSQKEVFNDMVHTKLVVWHFAYQKKSGQGVISATVQAVSMISINTLEKIWSRGGESLNITSFAASLEMCLLTSKAM